MVRGAPVWGWTWLRCGWRVAGESQSGLLCLQLLPEDMPAAVAPLGMQERLW